MITKGRVRMVGSQLLGILRVADIPSRVGVGQDEYGFYIRIVVENDPGFPEIWNGVRTKVEIVDEIVWGKSCCEGKKV